MTAALAACRFAHFLSAMLAFGAVLFLSLFAPQRLREALAPRALPWVRLAAMIALAAAIVRVPLQTADMMGEAAAALDVGAIGAVLTDTAFGRAWLAALALGAAFVVALCAQGLGAGAAALGGLALASLGLAGHAAMQAGAAGLVHRLNDALHLLCAGAWLGGLPLFVAGLAASRSPALRRDAVTAMTRFSLSGHVVVAGLLATGVVNVALTGGWPWPPATPYRALLDAKLVLVGAMVGLALVNRYALVPRLKTSPATPGRLRLLTLVNVALGAAVVGLVSLFGLLDPA